MAVLQVTAEQAAACGRGGAGVEVQVWECGGSVDGEGLTAVLELPPNRPLHADEGALVWRFSWGRCVGSVGMCMGSAEGHGLTPSVGILGARIC